jgi:integrase
MIGRKRTGIIECIDRYLITLRLAGHSDATRKYYGDTLRRFARRFDGKAPAQLTRDELHSYLREMDDAHISRSSLNTYIIVIRGFLAWLKNQGEIRANPLASLKIHALPYRPVPPLSQDEVARLFAAATTPLKRLTLLLLLDTGMRAGELCELQLADINLDLGEILVHGKGRKIRRVALNERPRVALNEYLAGRVVTNGSLWPVGWNRWKLERLVREMGQEAGVENVHPHRFRNTFAAWALRQGIGELALAVLLGHNSLAMVQRYVAAGEQERALEVHKRHPVA